MIKTHLFEGEKVKQFEKDIRLEYAKNPKIVKVAEKLKGTYQKPEETDEQFYERVRYRTRKIRSEERGKQKAIDELAEYGYREEY